MIFYKFRLKSGGLVDTGVNGYWSPTLSVKDPEIPYLPLEDAGGGTPTTFTISPSGAITFNGTVSQLHIRLQQPSGSIVFSGTNSFIRNRTFSISGFILFDGTAPITWEPAGGGGGSVTTWRTLTGMGT